MTATIVRPFKLPRSHLPGMTPRAVARGHLARAPRLAPPVTPPPALDSWRPGFSVSAAQDYYDELGARRPERPLTDPVMPDNVTTISSDLLGELAAQFVSYTEWLETELAIVEIAAAEEKAYLDHVGAEVRLGKAGTVADKESKMKNDARFIEAEQKQLVAEAKAKLLKARVRGYERCASALSREMTRRSVVPSEQ